MKHDWNITTVEQSNICLWIHTKQQHSFKLKSNYFWGSGCGTDGTAIASDIRWPEFESSRRQFL